MSDITDYCLGFLFDEYLDNVVLIKKERPDWQKGKLNGVGGKIEEGEIPAVAMSREFKEETGVVISVENWSLFGSMQGDSWCVHLFATSVSSPKVLQLTDEKPAVYNVDLIIMGEKPTILNIPMLLCAARLSLIGAMPEITVWYADN
jgi:8-oxo-dGTP diphosphatase